MLHLTLPPCYALQAFLEANYSDVELRSLAQVFADTELPVSLPGTSASVRALASAIVQELLHIYGSPPSQLWTYLLTTRGPRQPEIRRLQVAFGEDPLAVVAAPAEPPTGIVQPPAELHSASPAPPRRGRCDLLRCPRPSFAADPGDHEHDPFAPLRPGRINGMARELTLEWTAHKLVLRAIPTLYQAGERLPATIERCHPLHNEGFVYYPNGRSGCHEDALRPLVYRLAIEQWDHRARSITLNADCGACWRVNLSAFT